MRDFTPTNYQPVDRASAVAMRQSLLSDENFRKLVAAGDSEALAVLMNVSRKLVDTGGGELSPEEMNYKSDGFDEAAAKFREQRR